MGSALEKMDKGEKMPAKTFLCLKMAYSQALFRSYGNRFHHNSIFEEFP
jgi:hypothetical protein